MIIIEMNQKDIEYANRIMAVCETNTGIISPNSFAGIDDLIALGIVIGPTLITTVGNIIIEMIKKNKKVRIKVGDIEIEGLTEKNALEKLEKLLEYSKNNKNRGKK